MGRGGEISGFLGEAASGAGEHKILRRFISWKFWMIEQEAWGGGSLLRGCCSNLQEDGRGHCGDMLEESQQALGMYQKRMCRKEETKKLLTCESRFLESWWWPGQKGTYS